MSLKIYLNWCEEMFLRQAEGGLAFSVTLKDGAAGLMLVDIRA